MYGRCKFADGPGDANSLEPAAGLLELNSEVLDRPTLLPAYFAVTHEFAFKCAVGRRVARNANAISVHYRTKETGFTAGLRGRRA